MGQVKFIAIALFSYLTIMNAASLAQKAPTPESTASAATEAWQKEYDDICSKTQDAMTFSIDQLSVLVKRCDALQPQIDKLDDTRKKVYSRKLAQCRGLFAYVLESKQKEKK